MTDTPFFLSAKFWRALVILFLVGAFLIGFWDEVRLVVEYFAAWFVHIVIRPVPIPYGEDTQQALKIVGRSAAIFIIGYLGVLAWMAQFTLPVQRMSDRVTSFWRLFLYNLPILHLHGPAVFVKDGKPIATDEELASTKRGVALVDLYSAIVVEDERGARIRAAGPGITFTGRGEKLIGFVDLRQQSRSRSDVSCNTVDGIEVTTKVSASFTLGQPPDILPVTRHKNEWMVVKVEDNSEGKKIIASFSDELEEGDKAEIDQFMEKNNIQWMIGNPPERAARVPFVFDKQRVLNAIYSRARNVKEGSIGEWTELPVDIAVEMFRNQLAHELYEELYLPEEPEEYPMKRFKTRFANSVRNAGILGHQVVRRGDGQPLEKGQAYDELLFSAPQDFKRSTGMRERGIKILAAGFGGLVPTGDVVQKSFLDHWRARRQQEADKTTAELELEAMRIRNAERARAQQDMIYSLSRIFQSEQFASEALALRLYEALELAATQPATQRLLPADTVESLKNLKEWLLPDQKKDEHTDDLHRGGT